MNLALAFAAGFASLYLPMVLFAAMLVGRHVATPGYGSDVRKYGPLTMAFAVSVCVLAGPVVVAVTALNTAPRNPS